MQLVSNPPPATNGKIELPAANSDRLKAARQHLLAQEHAQALGLVNEVLQRRPQDPGALALQGLALAGLGRLQEALSAYLASLEIDGQSVATWTNLGNLLQRMQRFADAWVCYQRGVTLDPHSASTLCNMANALLRLGHYDLGLDAANQAIQWRTDYVNAYATRAQILGHLGELDAALQDYARAIAMEPHQPHHRWNRANTLLLNGALSAAWPDYECRQQLSTQDHPLRDHTQPRWQGQPLSKGATIFVYPEQGLGDTIQFSRYVLLLIEQGAHVILQTPAALAPVLQTLHPHLRLVTTADEAGPFDWHCPLMSLPLAFNTHLDTIPAYERYLSSLPDRLQRWSACLGPQRRARIGIAWSGNPDHHDDVFRSLALNEFLSFLPVQADYFCLQKDIRSTDLETLRAREDIFCFGPLLEDFGDTAALCELMDLVVSVDTSVAHLAAAMGKDTWILLAHNQDWRWLMGREDSPWYPSVRLIQRPPPPLPNVLSSSPGLAQATIR